MFKPVLTLIFCSLMMPSAMTANIVSNDPLNVVTLDDDDDDDDDFDFDRDDDDKDHHAVRISRPVVVCRNISGNRANLILKVKVHNNTNRKIAGIVSYEVEDKEGHDVAKVNDKIIIPAHQSVVSKSMVGIKNPHLYSKNKGYRYKVEAEVLDIRGKEISKERSSKFVIKNGNGTLRKISGNNVHVKRSGNSVSVKRTGNVLKNRTDKMVKLERAIK